MRASFYTLALFGLLATSVCTQSDDSSSDGSTENSSEGSGKVADTDTSKYAGVYEFTYFFAPNSSNAKETAQLKCDNVTGFTLDIPGAGGVDIARDFSNAPGGADPVYGTQLGTWVVKELFHGSGFDMLKLNVFINDDTETLACWALKKSGNDIIANLNPNNASSCPSRYIPSTKVCKKDTAFLYGKCKSGACTGDGTAARTTKSDGSKNKVGSSSANIVSPMSGFFASSIITLAVAFNNI